jgi:hypothetical protein
MTTIDPFHRVVRNMMTRYSAPATLLSQGAGVYDPATSSYTAVVTPYAVRIIPFDYIKKGDGVGEENNSLIQTGDRQIFLEPPIQSLLPAMPRIQPSKDKLQVLDKIYRIIALKDLNPTMADTIIYEMYVRE